MKTKNKHNRNFILKFSIIILLLCVVAAILIANLFVPVKYISAYIFTKKVSLEEGDMRVHFLNVSGDCTLIEFPDGKTMLIDAGCGDYSSQLKIFRALNSVRNTGIDFLVCTSVKNEHSRGLSEILDYIRVGRVFAPLCLNYSVSQGYSQFVKSMQKTAMSAEIIQTNVGYSNTEYGYFFCFLSPIKANSFSEYNKLNADNPSEGEINNCSAVLYVEYAGTGILILSDAGKQVCQNITNTLQTEAGFYGINTNKVDVSACKIISAAGHGNKDCAYAPLYDLIQPEKAIISVYDGEPSSEAVSDMSEYAEILRTDICGTITLTITQNGYYVNKERQ